MARCPQLVTPVDAIGGPCTTAYGTDAEEDWEIHHWRTYSPLPSYVRHHPVVRYLPPRLVFSPSRSADFSPDEILDSILVAHMLRSGVTESIPEAGLNRCLILGDTVVCRGPAWVPTQTSAACIICRLALSGSPSFRDFHPFTAVNGDEDGLMHAREHAMAFQVCHGPVMAGMREAITVAEAQYGAVFRYEPLHDG